MSEQPVIVAKIGAPHGVRGDLKLHSFTEDPARILSFESLLLEKKLNQFEPLSGYQIYQMGGGFFIHFENCQDRDLARVYTHKHLAVSREALGDPEEGEFYWRDLEGLTVVNQAGVRLGQVDHLFDTGSNDVLVIKGGEKPHLVPYVAQHVLSVDLDKGEIQVDWDVDF